MHKSESDQIPNTLTDKEADYIFDGDHTGKPLVIAFSFAQWDQPCQFDFVGRLKKIEGLSGDKFNKIFLKDPHSRWYHYGIEGLGEDIDQVKTALQQQIDHLRPSKIITIGQSMGGYAALVYGALLKADKVIAFCPAAFMETERLALYNDYRYWPAMQELNAANLAVRYFDIPTLYKQTRPGSNVHILFGTKGDGSEESVHLDAMHALNLESIENTQLHPYPQTDHLIIQHLVNNKMIDTVLLKLMFDLVLVSKSAAENHLSEGWYQWIYDNLINGYPVEALLETAMQSDSSDAEKDSLKKEIIAAENHPFIRAAQKRHNCPAP